jgi:opacity protein-like surface antigen
MKALTVGIAATLLIAAPDAALAQDSDSPRLMRGDVSGTVGWVNVNRAAAETYNNWRGQGAFGVALGWYWNNHVKTEVDGGTTTETSVYSSGPVYIPGGGQPLFASSTSTFSTARLGITHRYQFGDNEWVHPFVGAGIDLVREEISKRDEPLFGFDPITRQSRLVRDALRHPERSQVTARAVLTAGLKAYASRRAFFLADVRVGIRQRAEDVQWRIGAGVDF